MDHEHPAQFDRQGVARGFSRSTDNAPRINYVSSVKGQMYWRSLTQPGTEHKMSALEPLTDGNARRWIPGTRKLIVQGKLPEVTRG